MCNDIYYASDNAVLYVFNNLVERHFEIGIA